MSSRQEKNKPSQPEVYRPTAIPLSKDFEFIHAPYSNLDKENKETNHLFVGRQQVAEKLTAFLKSENRKRGSYLIAGYRGVGKTSIVNYAIKEYEENAKKETLKVHLNLGERNQLTPLDIFHSIAKILHKGIERKSGRFRKSLNTYLINSKIIYIPFALFAVVLFLLIDQKVDTGIFGEDLIKFLPEFLILFILFHISASIFHSTREQKDLKKLIDRITSETSEHENAGFSKYVELGLSKHKKLLPANVREVEEELSWIIGELNKKNYKVILILDELDKLSDDSEIFAQKFHHQSNPQEVVQIDLINNLLSSLKSFITTAHATFFFISGRETLDRYYSEKGSPNSLYESLFDRVFEVPTFLTDQSTISRGTRTQITKLVEEYVCCRLLSKNPIAEEIEGKKKKLSYECNQRTSSYFSLKNYHKAQYCPFERFERDVDEKYNEESIHRHHISILRDFIYYLTFHSWGNPKRLSALFEAFIVPSEGIDEDLKKNWCHCIQNYPIKYWLVFDTNHLRSFSLAAELTGLFIHQLSREVSSISDKLTISTFSAIHLILKFHSHGFTRSSLQRMSEAIGTHRSPEFNTILNDLLAHTFNPYIRSVRNGLYRHRFYLGIEQELQYVGHVSDLESVTYNSSLDSMQYVKHFYENIIASSDKKEISANSGAHIVLGDICAIEQSYTNATVHYNIACNLLLNLLDKSDTSVHHDILLQYVEVMLKLGDLEERKQNLNSAAAIYFEAERIVERSCDKDTHLKENLRGGSSKWILLKQPFWASHFLSLKRSSYSFDSSPENRAIVVKPDYLYSENDQNFYRAAAALYLYSGNVELAGKYYEKTISKINEQNMSQAEYDERTVFLEGNVQIGKIESNLLSKFHDFFNLIKTEQELKQKLKHEQEQEQEPKDSAYFNELFKLIKKEINKCDSNSTESLFKGTAKRFEDNGLYIDAATTYLKAISYYTAILDVFHPKTFSDSPEEKELIDFTKKNYHNFITKIARKAIRCINKARRLDSGHNNKQLLISSLHSDEKATDLTKLFEMLLFKKDTNKEVENFPADEEAFWQHSLWAQKLAALLLWAHYVEYKITGCHADSLFTKFPQQLSSLATRPTILIWWVQARVLSQAFISKKLLRLSGPYLNVNICSAREILMNHHAKVQSVNIDAEELIAYLKCKDDNCSLTGDNRIKNAYFISRNLYFSHAYSRIISRKNFDLIFPRTPQIYYVQWKLLLNIIITMWVAREQKEKYDFERNQSLNSIRDFSYLLQRKLVAIDEEEAPHQRIPPSHFDYEYIHLRLSEMLDNSINLIHNTSNTHKAIFQNKYFCHDDYSDPEFHTDYMLANMFIPSALLYKETVDATHKQLCKVIRSNKRNE